MSFTLWLNVVPKYFHNYFRSKKPCNEFYDQRKETAVIDKTNIKTADLDWEK